MGSRDQVDDDETAARRAPVAIGGALAVGAVLLAVGVRALADHGPSVLGVVALALGAAAVVRVAGPDRHGLPPHGPSGDAAPVAAGTGGDGPVPGPGRRWVLSGAALAASIAAAVLAARRGLDASTRDISALWLAGMALLVLATVEEPRRSTAWWARVRGVVGRRPDRAAVAAAVVVAVAAFARLVRLDRFPTVIDSDEGFMTLPARVSRYGDLANPWVTGFFGHPQLYPAVQGLVARPFADDMASYRSFTAGLGIASVVACWRLGRRLLGGWAGIAGAAFLALLPLHLWASRNGMDNVTDAAGLSISLLFLTRALDDGTRRDALVAGLALGLTLHGYYGALILPVVAAAVLVLAVVRPAPGVAVRAACRRVATTAAWVAAGLTAGGAPILGFWISHPEDATARFRTVSVGTADPTLLDRIGNAPTALLRPWHDQLTGFYRQASPSIGWALAPLVAIGVAAWLTDLRSRRTRPEALLLAWLVVAAVLSQTTGQQSQRFVGLALVWCLAAGTGLVTAVAALRAVLPDGRTARSGAAVGLALAGVAVALVAVVGLGHAAEFYDEDRQIAAYSNEATVAAYDLGWRLGRTPGPPPIVVLEGASFSYKGYGNLRFLAPWAADNATAVDPLPSDLGGPPGSAPLPAVADGTVLVLPARSADAGRCPLRARFPAATMSDVRDRRGVLLYVALHLGDGPGLADAPSPAETVLGPADTAGCRAVGG